MRGYKGLELICEGHFNEYLHRLQRLKFGSAGGLACCMCFFLRLAHNPPCTFQSGVRVWRVPRCPCRSLLESTKEKRVSLKAAGPEHTSPYTHTRNRTVGFVFRAPFVELCLRPSGPPATGADLPSAQSFVGC